MSTVCSPRLPHSMVRQTTDEGFESRGLRRAWGTYATGVAIATTCAPNGDWVGLTINSFSSASLAPPLVLWSLDLASPSRAVFEAASHYAVNVLSAEQEDLSNRFASRVPDKFGGLNCGVGEGGTPLIPDCLAWFECQVVDRHIVGDHLLLIGRVLAFSQAPEAPGPLVFQNGAYRRLA